MLNFSKLLTRLKTVAYKVLLLFNNECIGFLSIFLQVSSVLTEEERYRLREVIMTDEKIQTILKETHTTEQMLMIKDYRQIEKIIHPQKWDVLIRIIDNAGDQSAISGRKSSEDRSSTYGRKTTASSMTGQEMRYVHDTMIIDKFEFTPIFTKFSPH